MITMYCTSHPVHSYNDWRVYGGNKENNHYSSLKEIDTGNAPTLQVAWEFHTQDSGTMSQIQMNPIVIDGMLYAISPKLKLFALDAATGKQKWVFDPQQQSSGEPKPFWYFMMNVCRGVAYYSDGKDDKRIL